MDRPPLLSKIQQRIADLLFVERKTPNEAAAIVGLHPSSVHRNRREILRLLDMDEESIDSAVIALACSRMVNGFAMPPDISTLTDREFAIAQQIASGFDNPTIAKAEGTTPDAVNSVTRTIYRKLCISSSDYGRHNRLLLVIRMMNAGAMPVRINETVVQLRCLSKPENEAAYLAAQGLSTSEIAQELGKSTSTIKNQLTAVYQKLGISDQKSLMVVTFAAGWVSPLSAMTRIDGYAEIARKFNNLNYEW